MTVAEATIICLALVAADILARTWRIQALARGLGCRTSFVRVFTLNVASDAAASLTPLRVGGEPTRFAGIMYAGLSAADTIALISIEGTMEYLSLIPLAAYIGTQFAGEWWTTTSHRLVPALHRALPWLALILIAGVLLLVLLHRLAPRLFVRVHGTLQQSLRTGRRISLWAVLVSLPLTWVHLVSRLAILPVLMLTLDAPPPLGAVWFGSFVLLYGQLFLPTPSGAGAIDLGFLSGAAGYAGPSTASLLVRWRFYTTVIGVILGVIAGVPLYGSSIRRWLLRESGHRHTLHGGPAA